MRAQLAGNVCVWKQVIVLPLCVCLLAAGSAQAAENQVLSVRASETERLRDLLSGKRINASFADGNRLQGRVKGGPGRSLDGRHQEDQRPQFAAAWTSGHPHGSDLHRAVHRYKGYKRVLLGVGFFLGGYGLAVGIIEGREGSSGVRTATAIGGWSAMTALGYLWGKKKDKKNVTLVIQQPKHLEVPDLPSLAGADNERLYASQQADESDF